MREIKAVYPGTFDPITNGHMDIIKRALKIVDTLVVAVADDIPKTPIFTVEQRVEMVKKDVSMLDDEKMVEVLPFSGLLVEFASEQNSSIIIRGLRAVSDFEYEFQLSAMNYRLRKEIQTVFLPSSEKTQFIASKLVKEIARLGGDVSPFVSDSVVSNLKEFFSR